MMIRSKRRKSFIENELFVKKKDKRMNIDKRSLANGSERQCRRKGRCCPNGGENHQRITEKIIRKLLWSVALHILMGSWRRHGEEGSRVFRY